MSKKDYCTQNNGDCLTCSLVNYGMDCLNNPVKGMAPITSMAHKGIKMDRALATYKGFSGGATVSHILRIIGDDLSNKLTGHELGLVMAAVNQAYYEGAKKGGQEITDFICLPTGVNIWDVIGDKDYLGYKTFPDGLNIPNVLEARGQLVAQWKKDEEAI